MNALFIFGFDLGHAGLALSIGLAACLNAALLYFGLRRQGVYHPLPGWQIFTLKLAVALAVMAGVLIFAAGPPEQWLAASSLYRVGHLTLVVILGTSAYFATLAVLGFRPADFRRRAAE